MVGQTATGIARKGTPCGLRVFESPVAVRHGGAGHETEEGDPEKPQLSVHTSPFGANAEPQKRRRITVKGLGGGVHKIAAFHKRSNLRFSKKPRRYWFNHTFALVRGSQIFQLRRQRLFS